MTRNLKAALLALFTGLMCFLGSASADDIDIYTNPQSNPSNPPNTVLVIDLNEIGVCDNVLTDAGGANSSYNLAAPLAPSACADLQNLYSVTTYLSAIGLNATTFLSSLPASTLCTMVNQLGLTSPSLSVLGVGTLTCSTLSVLSSLLPVASLTSFTASLVTALLVPLTPTLLSALPSAFLATLSSTLSASQKILVDPASIFNLTNTLGSILSNLVNSNVAIMVSHSNRASNGAQVANGVTACTFSSTRNATTPCANGAYFLVGLTALTNTTTVNALLTKVSNLLFNALGYNASSCTTAAAGTTVTTASIASAVAACTPNATTLTTSLASLTGLITSPSALTPPFQGKEAYDEIIHYVTGDVIYNAPLGNTTGNLYDGVFSLLSRDTTIEASGSYKAPTLACPTINVLNLQTTNSGGDSDSDTDLTRFFSSLTTGAGESAFTSLVQSAYNPGFSDSKGKKYILNSAFVVQQTLTGLTNLQSINANVLTYADMTGLLNLGKQVSTLLKPPLNIDASLVTPSLTTDLTSPSSVRPEAFFTEFKPNTTQTPRWNGNLKKLKIAADSSGNYQYYDANNAPAIDTTDGRISKGALTYWTSSTAALLGTTIDSSCRNSASADGRCSSLGGAGQNIPGFSLLGGGNPGRSNTDSGSTTLRTLYYDHIASGVFSIAGIDASSSTTTSVTELISDLGVSTAATYYETAANCGTNKTSAQVAQELLLYARGYDTGGSCQSSKGSTSVVGRSWMHGAVLHSRPVAINYGTSTTGGTPNIRIVYGSADGYMRMVNNSTGAESWAFMPRTVMSQQKILRDNISNTVFPYGVDGAPAVLTIGASDGVISGSSDHAYLYFGLRRSGKYYYAMDVTSPDSPSLMWRIGPDGLYKSSGLVSNSSSNYAELGLTFSSPQIGKMSIGATNPVIKPVLIFAGGYNGGVDSSGNRIGKDLNRGSAGLVGTDDSIGNAIYIVDAVTGDLIWKAVKSSSTSASYSSTTLAYSHPMLTNSIPSDVTALDTDGDGLTDRLYVADTGGRLWRADLSGSDPSKWTFVPVASVGRYGTSDVPNDRRFFSAPDYAPIRNNKGGSYDEITFGSGDREDPLNVTTLNYFYAYRDPRTSSGVPSPVITTESDSNLKHQSDFTDLTTLCAAASGCTSTPTLTTGWKISLSGSGEKMFSQPLSVSGNVFFTTYTPPNPTTLACTPSEGGSAIYSVSLYDSHPAGVITGWTTRSTASVLPGMPGELSPISGTAISANNQPLTLPATLPTTVYWRERRGDEEPKPQ